MSNHPHSDVVTLRLPVTIAQLRAIIRRAGVGPFDGAARGAFIVGGALGELSDGELSDALRERVRAVAATTELSPGAGL